MRLRRVWLLHCLQRYCQYYGVHLLASGCVWGRGGGGGGGRCTLREKVAYACSVAGVWASLCSCVVSDEYILLVRERSSSSLQPLSCVSAVTPPVSPRRCPLPGDRPLFAPSGSSFGASAPTHPMVNSSEAGIDLMTSLQYSRQLRYSHKVAIFWVLGRRFNPLLFWGTCILLLRKGVKVKERNYV